MTSEYFELPGFEAVYLEDSFVLDINARPSAVTIDLDVVLTEHHPEYEPPAPDSRYCYRRGQIRFEGVRRLHWIAADVQPARDATGEIDYGGVDEFLADGSSYSLAGEFGQLTIEADACRLVLGSGHVGDLGT